MIDWHERERATAAIRARWSPLKILLKTRDDPYFLEHWITHHAGIVGLENLVIFDNGSTDPRALSVLAGFDPELLVIRFAGSHNRLHSAAASRDLYAALAQACRHFVFLDTDETLVLFRGHRHAAGPAVLDFIAQCPAATVIPTLWLWSVPRQREIFSLGEDFSQLHSRLQGGKPVFAAGLDLSGFLNHSFQLPSALFSGELPVGLFVLHHAQLSPAQRMRANIRKLVSRGLISETDSVDAILARGRQLKRRGNVGRYFSQIAALRDETEPRADESRPLRPGEFALRADGSVDYFGASEMFQMFGFLMRGSEHVRAALDLPRHAHA